MRMKRIFRTLCGLVLASVALSSCLGDDDDKQTTTYSDVAITQFTLGSLNRYTTTKSAATGNDTVVKTVVTGSNYKMTIDQLGRRIFNQQKLPMGTDVKHVVCTIATKNGGAVALKSTTSDEMQWFNASDSIDFSEPRTFRVYSIDGTATRDYTVTLTASDNEGLDFSWQRVGTVGAATEGQHLVALGDTVRMVDRSIITRGSQAFRIGSLGTVETSENLVDWSMEDGITYEDADLGRLIGASTAELYALSTDGRLMVSRHRSGATWSEEQLDDAMTLLPDEDIAMVSWPYGPVDDTDYVLMAGTNTRLAGSEAGYACLWRKLSSHSAEAEVGQWVYMPLDDTNHFQLPALSHLTMTCYEGVVLAVGADMVMRQSRDQGITWPVSATYALPTALQAAWVSMATDAQGRLWLLTDTGELWQGARR